MLKNNFICVTSVRSGYKRCVHGAGAPCTELMLCNSSPCKQGGAENAHSPVLKPVLKAKAPCSFEHGAFLRINCFISSVIASHYGNHLAENFDGIHYNGLVIVVFRLKAEMTVLFIKALYRCGIFHKSNHNFAVARFFGLAYNNNVVVKNSALNHGIAANPKGKNTFGVSGIRNVFLHLFVCKNGRTRRNAAQHGNCTLRPFGKVIYGNGAVLVFAHGYAALRLKLLKIAVNGGGGANVKLRTDFAHRGRIAEYGNMFAYICKNSVCFVLHKGRSPLS